MHCVICDKTMSEKEIDYNSNTKEFEPCVTCLEVIRDTAYPDGNFHDGDEYVVVEEFDATEPFTFDQLDVFGRLD